jgi:uncharacterized protein
MTNHSQPDSVSLICPKCRGEMHTYERNGVLIDQCDGCRGIFLDRGEIERLIVAGNPPAEPKSGPGGSRWSARERKKRADASAVIADMLVLMASEPKQVPATTHRPAGKRPPIG